MKILLIGNPNVGKNVVFNRLTGVDVISSNYPGTTISFTKGYVEIDGNRYEVINVPGTYTLEPACKAEEIAVNMIEDGYIIINVVDSTNLGRNLSLTLQLIKRNKPVIVCLNLWDETGHTGIVIDVKKPDALLDVPCVPCCAVTGIPIAAIILFLTFSLIRFIGESLIGYVFEPLFENVRAPLIMRLSHFPEGSGFIHDLLLGKLFDNNIDFGQSFG